MAITAYTGTSPDKALDTLENFATNVYDTGSFYVGGLVEELNENTDKINEITSQIVDYNIATYDSGTLYSMGFAVDYSGSRYFSKVDNNLGNQPDLSTTQWQIADGAVSNDSINVTYDNSQSGLTATNLQAACSELDGFSGGTADFVANGSITAGYVVAINSDGVVSMVTGGTIQNWIGIATNSVSDTDTVTITILTGANKQQSGLITNTSYFLDTDGTLTTTDTGYRIGTALSATDILIEGNL